MFAGHSESRVVDRAGPHAESAISARVAEVGATDNTN
jgi:hypothetical protein